MKKERNSDNPSLTIVGGQPNRGRSLPNKVQVPVGVEKLLYTASRDDAFKRRLLEDRRAAIEESGVKLRQSEVAMLTAIPDNTLRTMIENIVPQNPKRRRFMGLVAAAAASLVAGTIDTACDSTTMGIGPDTSDTESETDSQTDSETESETDLDAGPDGGSDTDTVDTDTDTDVWLGARPS